MINVQVIADAQCRPETYNKADVDSGTGKPLQKGLQLEDKSTPKKNEGFFEKGLLRALETTHRTGDNAREVKVVANGHCHGPSLFSYLCAFADVEFYAVTESCRRVRGMWFCFGGGGYVSCSPWSELVISF